jgi:hypothetical protein
MTEHEFLGKCIQRSGGTLDSGRVKQIYHDLMKDAGLATSDSPMKSDPEDNGDYSWEYYSEGKVVSEDDYAKHAHGLRFKS